MAFVNSPKFNWLPRPTMWQEVQRERDRQVNLQQADELNQAIVNKLANVNAINISSKGNLAAKAALSRIQAATKAKQAKQQAQEELASRNKPRASLTPKDITLSDGTIIKGNPTITLAGGTQVNTKLGVLTLTDGTQISLLTGRKIDVST